MDRRIAIQRIGLLMGAALSAPTAAGLLAGCRNPSGTYVPQTLNVEAFGFVRDLAESILPESDTPGARGAGVHRFIDAMLTDYYPADERQAFLAGLLSLMPRLDPTNTESVSRLDADAFARNDSFFRRFKELVISGYYMSEVGATEELHLMPMGPFRGDAPLSEIGRTWA